MSFLVVVLVLLVIVLAFFATSVVVANEYERGVVFRLGRVMPVRGPGLFVLVPFIDKVRKVSLQLVTLNVPPQEVITRDNVTLKVNAITNFKVVNPVTAVVQVENFLLTTSQVAQTSLRSVLGQFELDELLANRKAVNQQLEQMIDTQTTAWGVQITSVEIKDIELPQQMQRAIAAQAEAERERRAKAITALGEFEASQNLAKAAQVIGAEPAALQLRYLQTVAEVGGSENTSTLIVPFPTEMLRFFGAFGGGDDGHTGNGGGPSAPRPIEPPGTTKE